MSDMTWALAYEPGTDTTALNEEPELAEWWIPFIHPDKTINILLPDSSVRRMNKTEFIGKFTQDPPEDDPL